MQLEKEKKEKQERERCRALAQRIAEEAAAASAALLGEQSLLLTKALRRAGVAAEVWAEGSEAELLVVVDPAYETLPEKLPARVLLVSSESTVMAGWAEQLAQRGYFRDFGWRSKGRAQQSALFCASQPTGYKMVRGYELEMDILRDRMVRAERTCGEEAGGRSERLEVLVDDLAHALRRQQEPPALAHSAPLRPAAGAAPGRDRGRAGAGPCPPRVCRPLPGQGHARGPLRLGGAAGASGGRSARRPQDQHRGAPV